MNGRFGELVIGWVFVGTAILIVVAVGGRWLLGNGGSWIEWPVVIAFAGLFVLIGVANLLLERPPWLIPLVVGACGPMYLGMGLASLIDPGAMTVDVGRGPHTTGSAMVVGVVMTLVGVGMLAGAWYLYRNPEDSPQ